MTRVVWFHPRPLVPAQGGGDLRTLGLVGEVGAAGHAVLMVVSGTPHSDAPSGVEMVPVAVRYGAQGLILKAWSRHPLRSPRSLGSALEHAATRIADFAPQVAVVSEVMTGSLAFPLLPDLPWIYDAHNVEHTLFARLADEARGFGDRVTFAVDRRRVAAAERELVARADAVIAVSASDAAGLAELQPRRHPVVVPSSVPTPPVPAEPGTARPVMLFVGTLDYPPNDAAVRELIGKVFPAVRERVPDARLVIGGRKASDQLRALLVSTSGIDFEPDLPDLSRLYRQARCVVLPIRYGGGSRLKVYEAFAWGQATVGTAAAFDGVPIPPGTAMVAETVDAFAEAVTRVLTDDKHAAEMGSAARAHFVAELALPRVTKPLVELIEELGSVKPQ